MSITKRFESKNGLDANAQPIIDLGVLGSSLTQAGAFAVTLTATAATNVTLPTSGTLLTTTGNAATSTSATNLLGGAVNSIPYQTGAGTTAFLAQGTGVLTESAGAPSWSTAPTLTGTNFSAIPNSALTNSSLTLGTTSVALGATTTTLSGLTSVTATTFVGALTGMASGNLPLSGGTLTGSVNFGGLTATNLATPVNSTDVANKAYVDAAINGLSWKNEALVATTANISLTGEQTIDGVLTSSSRVLVKNQTTASQNGIYISNASAWTRASDAATTAQLDNATLYVMQGTVNAATGWTQTVANPVIGTSNITFVQFSGSGSYSAGTGISISSNTISNSGVLSITGTTNQVTASASTGAITLSLPSAVTISGAVTAGSFAGSGSGLTSIPNSALTNSSITIGSTAIALGVTSTTLAGLTSVTSTNFVGALSGNATSATNVAGGTTNQILYQTGAGTTGFASASNYGVLVFSSSGTPQSIAGAAGVLVGSASAIPAFSTAPTLTGTNFTGIPNGALTNSSVTVGTTAISLGGSATALTGLTSVTSTAFTGALTGNASTATAIQTAQNFSIGSGDGTTGAVSFNGTAAVNLTLTLATVNSTPVTAGFHKITTNGKGLVTASSAVTSTDITTTLGFTPASVAGSSITGNYTFDGVHTVTGLPTPVNAADAAPKSYVDAALAGLEWKDAAAAATTANLTATYANGTSGVGATLTNAGTQAAFTVDGYTAVLNDRILIKNQTTAFQNGIYYVTSVGSVSTNWVLTRVVDANTPASLSNATLYVTNGTSNAGTGWTQTAANPTIGTTSLAFAQFSGSGSYAAGTGINIAGSTISNTGVLSITGTANQITASASTGSITLSLPSAVSISGAMTAGSFSGAGTGLTGTATSLSIGGNAATATSATSATTATNIAGGAAGSVPYQTAAGATSLLAAGTSSQVLVGGATPSWTNTPTLTGTNFTGIPNSGLTNSSVTVGSTAIALGSSATTLVGLTSVTSTAFVGALTGTASGNLALTGGTLSGNVTAPSVTVSTGGAGAAYHYATTLTTTSTTANQVVDSQAIATYRTIEYVCQVTNATLTSYQISKVLVMHDGTNVYITEYAMMQSGSVLATFDAQITGGNLQLITTPAQASSTVFKISATAITV
jgi:hypothetical protein